LGQQKDLAKEVGSIKAEIDKGNIKYQIKLADFNAKTIESCEKIYSSLLKLKGECKALDCNQTGAQRQKISNAADEFEDIFQLKRIWIPADISKKLELIAEEIKLKSEAFYAVSIKIEKLHQTQENPDLVSLYETQDQFYHYLDKELSVIFSDIVQDISTYTSAEDT
ncbi:hypothetical protein RCJ22_23275, partial [Vibrio sp. FNV 38]|nr:hypothetical protein [Vibrio sp. FNV 38]